MKRSWRACKEEEEEICTYFLVGNVREAESEGSMTQCYSNFYRAFQPYVLAQSLCLANKSPSTLLGNIPELIYLGRVACLIQKYLRGWLPLYCWNVSSLQSLFQGIKWLALFVEDFSAYWFMSCLRWREREKGLPNKG